MLPIDLTGKRALVAGVSDDAGFGFAIAKSLAEAGATICLGSWPPALGIFTKLLERGKIEDSLQLSGRPQARVRADLSARRRVRQPGRRARRTSARTSATRSRATSPSRGLRPAIREDFGEGGLDIVVHSLANGPEVKSPLVDTSRAGYLTAVSVSAYSNISLVRNLAPLMRPDGAFLSLTYLAGERVIPGYGGGMSSAKAALEADTRTLAYEAGRRWGVRVNAISAGPWASRAATAIGFIHTMIEYTSANAPLPRPIQATDVGNTAAFLCSPLAGGDHGERGVRGQRVSCDGDGGPNNLSWQVVPNRKA